MSAASSSPAGFTLSASFLVSLAAVAIAALLCWFWQQRRRRHGGTGDVRVTGLYIYPVKSCGGLSLSSSDFNRLGLRFDRGWMIADAESGRMTTAREVPHLERVNPAIDEPRNTLTLSCDLEGLGMQPLTLPLELPLPQDPQAPAPAPAPAAADTAPAPTRIKVLVWEDLVDAVSCGEEAAEWVTRVVNWTRPVSESTQGADTDTDNSSPASSPSVAMAGGAASARAPRRFVLVTLSSLSEHRRPLAAKYDWTAAGTSVAAAAAAAAGAFSDGFPLLLASQASLRALNAWTVRNGRRTEMQAFRPNIVVDGPQLKPWDEDWWRNISIGGETETAVNSSSSASSASPPTVGGFDFVVSKPCARCILTTVVPLTGARDASGEPLLSLRAHRAILRGVVPGKDADVFFAQNIVQLQERGRINVGDRVTVRERKNTRYETAPGYQDKSKQE